MGHTWKNHAVWYTWPPILWCKFVLYTKFRNMAAGRIIHPGVPQVGKFCCGCRWLAQHYQMPSHSTATQVGVAITLWIYIGEVLRSSPMECNIPPVWNFISRKCQSRIVGVGVCVCVCVCVCVGVCMCGCFGNTYTCFYCVLYCLYRISSYCFIYVYLLLSVLFVLV
jgi:hypothetical protein